MTPDGSSSYADSERGKVANLPSDYPLMIKALVIEGLSEALPKELGNIRFTAVVTDRYRLITLALSGRTVMMAMPLTVSPDPICDAAIRKFGIAPPRR